MFNPSVIDNAPLRKPTIVRIIIVVSISLDTKLLLLLLIICHISPPFKFFYFFEPLLYTFILGVNLRYDSTI